MVIPNQVLLSFFWYCVVYKVCRSIVGTSGWLMSLVRDFTIYFFFVTVAWLLSFTKIDFFLYPFCYVYLVLLGIHNQIGPQCTIMVLFWYMVKYSLWIFYLKVILLYGRFFMDIFGVNNFYTPNVWYKIFIMEIWLAMILLGDVEVVLLLMLYAVIFMKFEVTGF